MKKVSIYVTEKELDALEDTLMVWTFCKKHKSTVWNPKTGKMLTDQQLFKMQDECKACRKENLRVNRLAGRIMVKLFNAVDKMK